MIRTPAQALTAAKTQSAVGPQFGINECKKRVRLLYLVPSDGAQSAAIAWTRTEFRRAVATAMPLGTLIWWTGGRTGAGHVAIYAGSGKVWSTDIKRTGYFDLVDLEQIARQWPSLKLAGASYDIDGVRVVTAVLPPPNVVKPVPPKVTRVTQARALLLEALKHSGPIRARAIKAALAALPKR